jgi:DNA-binding response OmpR family regulator
MLLEGGYQVIAAASGTEALRLSRVHSDRIDLLLTDVMTPDMAGPAMRVLLKPFSSDQLTCHVRAALASGQTAKKEAQDQDPARLSRNA